MLFISGFAGDLDSNRMNDIRNEKVKVKFLSCHEKILYSSQYSKEFWGDEDDVDYDVDYDDYDVDYDESGGPVSRSYLKSMY